MSSSQADARRTTGSVDVHVADERERAAAFELRRRVFFGEQGVSEAEEYDGRDEEAIHLVVVAGGRVLATCRLVHDGGTVKLGRMAVERAHRGRGVGTALLLAGEDAARAAGARSIALHAQTRAQDFYARQGFQERGKRFMEAGIEHIAMDKRLA